MSVSVGKYTFASWLRRGIGNRITQVDRLGGAPSGVNERATVPVDVVLNETGISKSFMLIGPGDIIGINPQMVVRTEPLLWIGDFEPNYLAFIEFYDEDFVWRYTPASPNGEKLSPWLALLVLKAPVEGKGGEYEVTDRRDPLPTLKVTAPAALPSLSRNWAFSHVHINEGHASPSDFEKFLLSLHDVGAPNADKIIARQFSARRLEADTAYRAFLVPAFETGRLAGLKEDPSATDSQKPAWTPGTAVELPFYYDWSFRAGAKEDFESLVKLLEPRPVDKRVGIRDMDASAPEFGVASGADIGAIPSPPALFQTTLGLEGALRAPTTISRPRSIDPAKPFFDQLAAVLNLADDRQQASAGAADPVVTPPIYGGKHAMLRRVDFALSGWLSFLNRDPRLRVSAGLGTRVIQTNQEDYVARAWAQVKTILEANRRIRQARLTMEAVKRMQVSLFAKLPPAALLAIARPVTRKVMGSPVTIHHQIGQSTIANAPLDAAMRRLVRPRGALARRLAAADPGFSQSRLVEDVNAGRVTAAPPKKLPQGLPADDALAKAVRNTVPGWLAFLVLYLWWVLLLLAIAAVLLLLAGFWPLALFAIAAGIGAFLAARRGKGPLDLAAGLADPGQLARGLAEVPPRPGFQLVVSDPLPGAAGGAGSSTAPGSNPAMPPGFTGMLATYSTPAGAGQDTVEAANFRRAAIALARRLSIRPVEPPRVAMDLAGAAAKLAFAMEPERAWPNLIAREVMFTFGPDWLRKPENLVPAMAYPDFDDPMYEKLRDLSAELFLPNIKLIEPETITLLKTNPAFIEAYMVGLNHEFGRELLWREYPTDERGSYFRQFWSVRGLIEPKSTLSAEETKAMYRDIVPIDIWPSASILGTHRPPQRPKTGDLVLTIRGTLLKRYPNTLIYAQKAHMATNEKHVLDATMKPVIKAVESQADMDAELKFPIFSAEVLPDIRFFGFDLTIEQAKGAPNPKAVNDDWGWYFIIQELPGEPRFGMDIKFDPDDNPKTPITWNDLGWDKLPAGNFVDPAAPPVPAFMNKLSNDLKAQWGRHAADMASILFQRPVMIAVHAREMLEKLDA